MTGSVLGRKNYYGSRFRRGTEVAAFFYSLIESAKLCDIDPKRYLLMATRAALRIAPPSRSPTHCSPDRRHPAPHAAHPDGEGRGLTKENSAPVLSIIPVGDGSPCHRRRRRYSKITDLLSHSC